MGEVEVGVGRRDTGEWHWSRRGLVWTAKQNTRRLCMWELSWLSSQGEEHFMHGFWSSQGNPLLSTEGTRGKCNKSCRMHQVSDLINTTVFGVGRWGVKVEVWGGVEQGSGTGAEEGQFQWLSRRWEDCRREKNCHPRWWKGMCYAWHSKAHIQSPVIYPWMSCMCTFYIMHQWSDLIYPKLGVRYMSSSVLTAVVYSTQ